MAVLTPFSAGAEEIVARLSYHWAPAHHSAIYCQKFADRVNERGAGKIRIETYPSGQLFGIREIMGALTSGAVELGGVVGTVSFPPVNKNYNAEGLPGVFQSFDHLRGFFRDDPAGKAVWDNILKRTLTTFVAYNPTGPYMSFSAVRPLDSVEAFQGLKPRYLAGLERPRWEALGASAISLPTREVYTSLQNGMIDTLSTVPSAIKAYSWWEYLKFGQKPYQFFADAFILGNQRWWDGLPDDVKQILLEVGEEISKESTESIMRFSDEVLEEFVKEQGGRVDELSGEELAKLEAIDREKVLPAIKDLIDADVLKAVQDYAAK
ncbi:TRAP transporter substrate-binding protein [Oceanibacterium hippocampi]|uniref:TRAP transporter substrate-binding protein n=1 Tax=Oceanibacterium hippocampi TaxID=745714 RepID=UPI0015939448|nr:TRAP transporter substrate-binding protein [Oceanibacterium hippocampi]